MVNYLWYTIKVSSTLIVLYAFYVLFLRNCTFFLLNRLYLIVTLFLSFIIPILNLSAFMRQPYIDLSATVNKIWIAPESNFLPTQDFSNDNTLITIPMILSAIYIAGVSILLLKFIFSIRRTIRIKNRSKIYRFGKFKIVKADSVVPFSFFNMIFLPKGENSSIIIEHEMAHILQFHWLDLVVAEIASVLLWYNPIVVLYKSSLKLQHEYLADDRVIKKHNQIENYLGYLLRRVHIASSVDLVNYFYCKTVKKRIIMITKNKTSIKYSLIYLLALPLMGLLLLAFTNSDLSSTLPAISNVHASADEYLPSICPVDIMKVKHIADFGKRINPITKKEDFHYGVDLATLEGEIVMSTAKGFVVEAKFDSTKGKGNYIIIKHNSTYTTFYSHLKSISVKAGDRVEKGQIIGYVGNTGLSTGSHLHYEVRKDGEAVNPKDYFPQ